MLELIATLISGAALGPAATACTDEDKADDYHFQSVCEDYLGGAPAYTATVRGSPVPRPATQQVMVYQSEGQWFAHISGFGWNRNGEVFTRRFEFAISQEEGEAVAERLSAATFQRLGKIEYYGDPNMICMDGARYEIAAGSGGKKIVAAQHSCAGKTEINEIMAMFRTLALKYDPKSEGLLVWLRD